MDPLLLVFFSFFLGDLISFAILDRSSSGAAVSIEGFVRLEAQVRRGLHFFNLDLYRR